MVLLTVCIGIKGVEKSMPTPTVKNTFPNTYVALWRTAFTLMFIYCKHKYNFLKATTLQISHCTVRIYFSVKLNSLNKHYQKYFK
jgi:hypothetical protein